MKVYEKLSINIVDVKVLIDWQSPVLEVLLWFWRISGSFQGVISICSLTEVKVSP